MAHRKHRAIRFALFVLLLPVAASSQETLWITHGPILGRLSAHGVGVWARTADSKPFQVAYGQTSENLDQLSAVVSPALERDNTGWVQIDGLRPDTKYSSTNLSFRVRAGLNRVFTRSRRFRIRPMSGTPSTTLKASSTSASSSPAETASRPIGTCRHSPPCSDSSRTGSTLPFRTGTGSTRSAGTIPLDRWAANLGARREALPRRLQIAPTIVGVWENYKLYLDRGKAMTEWHKEVPSFFTFDDHEILGDVNGAGTVGLRSRRAVFRDIGVQAWYDYLGWSNPVHNTQPIHFGRATLEGRQ